MDICGKFPSRKDIRWFDRLRIVVITCGLLTGGIHLSHAERSAITDRSIVAAIDTNEGLRDLLKMLEQSNDPVNPAPSRKDTRARKALAELAIETLQAPEGSAERSARLGPLREVMAAFQNNHRPPVPERMDFFEFPLHALIHIFNPIGLGSTPAKDLPAEITPDRGLRDPTFSTFWRRPEFTAGHDLYAGFGRTARPDLTHATLEYFRPKTSYGTNPGFDATMDGWRLKVKFGELHSESFTTRIFDALGYHADPTDFVPELRVRYNRRIFLEFNSRQPFGIRFQVLGILPAYHLQLQPWHDPFRYVAAAMLTNGTRITGAELRRRLLIDSRLENAAESSSNFRPEFEREIDHLITKAASIQFDDDSVKSLGPWDYKDLGHADRRELRGVALLAAWLGWFDTRFDNTRLKIVKHAGQTEYLHYFSDLGGGLGSAEGFFSGRGERPNEFGWTCTERFRADGGRGSWTRFRITGYRPIENNPAFRAMTIDDARWMARLIGQLTERQLVEALTASGFDSASVKLYTEKLISRRDTMIRQLELDSDIALLRPQGIDRNIDYDPIVDGPMKIVSGSGDLQIAPIGKTRVKSGRLEKSRR